MNDRQRYVMKWLLGDAEKSVTETLNRNLRTRHDEGQRFLKEHWKECVQGQIAFIRFVRVFKKATPEEQEAHVKKVWA